MREAMRLILENAGFDTREASDGKTALSMVRERPPDIMFLDLNIPGTSGADVLAELKGDEATRNIRVIIITATGEEGRELRPVARRRRVLHQALPTHRVAPNRRTGPRGSARDLPGRVVT